MVDRVKFDEAARIVQEIPGPHTHPRRGRILYKHIRDNRPEKVLELGTARGGSAVFITAALEANGAGHLTTVESLRWKRVDPSPQEVLADAGLSDWVTFDANYSTYTWFLKTEIEKNLTPSGSVRPVYDLIFLDGAKNWSTDGLAVVLIEKLLKPGGWLLLDDLGWSYGKNIKGTKHYGIEIGTLSDEETFQPHLRAIFDLLIKTNPAFDEFVIQDDWWGWARKSPDRSRHTGGGVLSGASAKSARAPQKAQPVAAGSALHDLPRRVFRRLPPSAQGKIRALRDKAGKAPSKR
jgi:predicted O-methyltransferase YrrM